MQVPSMEAAFGDIDGLETGLRRLHATLYSETISTHTRIIVNAVPSKLQDSDNPNRIRSLLLAGVRAAMLWYQYGSSRLHLLTKRRTLSRRARTLIDRIEENAEPATE